MAEHRVNGMDAGSILRQLFFFKSLTKSSTNVVLAVYLCRYSIDWIHSTIHLTSTGTCWYGTMYRILDDHVAVAVT